MIDRLGHPLLVFLWRLQEEYWIGLRPVAGAMTEFVISTPESEKEMDLYIVYMWWRVTFDMQEGNYIYLADYTPNNTCIICLFVFVFFPQLKAQPQL